MNTSSMQHGAYVPANIYPHFVGDIDNLEYSVPGLPASAPGHIRDTEKVQRLYHQRVQFIKLSSIARTARGPPGTTPPFQPAAPSLLRVSGDDAEADLVDQPREPSPLRNLAFSHYSNRVNSRMPHAVSMPYSGFQALILCGPGIGLSTFTSVPNEFPKALVEIANRPIVWYVLDWCYRAGITDITLIAPPESKETLAAALAQDPHLTSLPSPTPNLLAPKKLEYETATAELLRLPEVQKVIKSDFMLLPCDLICDIHGETFLDTYLSSIGGLGGTGISTTEYDPKRQLTAGLGGESSGRRGGLSIWYNTANREESVKKEECDFMCTVKLNAELSAPLPKSSESIGVLRNLVWAMPMSELKEQTEEDKSWRIRSSLLKKYGNLKCLTQYRDAHIYFFPYWVKEFAALNEDFESVSEDLVGTWAKAEWRKPDYRARFGANQIFAPKAPSPKDETNLERPIEEEIDLLSLSSTRVAPPAPSSASQSELRFASRVHARPEDSIISDHSISSSSPSSPATNPPIPPISACILPSAPTAPLVRRVDTTSLLLSVSLLLAKTSSIEDDKSNLSGTTSPFAHPNKVHSTASVAPQVTISKSDSLIGANTSIATRCVIKNSVIGANVSIGSRTRITGSVVMDGATIGEGVELNGTVIGKKCKLGDKVKLSTCEVQDGNVLADGTEGKGEKFLVGGLGEEDDDDFDDDDDDEDTAQGDGLSLSG